jgi:hypothetical protein
MSIDPATLNYDGDGLVACICQDAAGGGPDARLGQPRGRRAHARDRPRLVLRRCAASCGRRAHQRHTLAIVESADCDGDALLYRTRAGLPATGSETCWGERRTFPAALTRTIVARRDADLASSMSRACATS